MTQLNPPQRRARLREVLPTLKLGKWKPGRLNSITDVPGVLVHTESIQPDPDINTGVTTILPRRDWTRHASFAGIFRFNGCGEMTSSHWIEETGMLTSPIIISETCAIGDCYRGVLEYAEQHCDPSELSIDSFVFPLAAETFDGFLSNQARFPVKPEHVVRGIKNASSSRVPEGNTGGGTGMICHKFKGGTGSSSRVVPGFDVRGNPKTYTVGALVQANYGNKENLHIGGVPVGRIMVEEDAAGGVRREDPTIRGPRKDGSIIVIVGTDLPVLPVQLQRLAKRATVGLSKVGGYGSNTSGDIFLAFSTANKLPMEEFALKAQWEPTIMSVDMANNDSINGVFEAVADAVEEAICNALCMAETMTGFKGRTVEALDLGRMKEIVERHI